jgi:hypothetical protein
MLSSSTFARSARAVAAHQRPSVHPIARAVSPRISVFNIHLATKSFSSAPSYTNILVSRAGKTDGVSLITLNRPKALNALNSELFHELNDALERADADRSIGAIVLTGSEKAFAAGADIKEMKDKSASEAYSTNFLGHWTKINSVRKPTIAAVSGYALGGGCELAMMYICYFLSWRFKLLNNLYVAGVISSSPLRTPSLANPKSTCVLSQLNI